MFSLPYSILVKGESNIIPQDVIQEHQSFCKLFIRAKTQYEKKKNNSKINPKEKNKDNQTKIWNWFEKLSYEQKLKICSIKNKWLVKIIIQLFIIYKLENKHTFEPINSMLFCFSEQYNSPNLDILDMNNKNFSIFPQQKEYLKYRVYNKDDYCTLYFKLKENEYSQNIKEINPDELELQKKLVDNIILLSLNDEELDTISLDENLIKDTKFFKHILEYFSDNNYFKSWLTPLIYNNINNFPFPEWMHGNKNLTFCRIVSGIFEQKIL